MNKIFVLIFFLSISVARSQVVSDSVIAFNCNQEGAIFLDIVTGSLVDWYFDDDSLGLILVSTMQDVVFNGFDTLFTQQCGTYKVVFAGDTSFFFVGCLLGSGGLQLNVKCFGDSTGKLKRVAHSGSPPYFYEWFKNGMLYSSGSYDTLFENLSTGSYKIVITDTVGCSDSITSTIASPISLIFDTIFTSNINCRGVNSGSISCSVSGGKKYTVSELYDYYIINLNSNDTVSWLTRDSTSLDFSSVFSPYQITFDSLFAGEYILSVVDSFGCILDEIFEIKEPIDYLAFGSTVDLLICESDSGYLKIDTVLVDSILGSQNIFFGFAYNLINGIHIDSIYASSGWYDIYVYDSTYFCLDTVPIRCEALYEIKVFENISPVLCFGDQTGSVVIDSIIDGNTPYDVQWGGVNSSELLAGTYSVNIVDSIGCLHTEIYIILQGIQINSNAVLYQPLCFGDANGSISIDVSGGTGPLSYYWLNGAGSSDSLYYLVDDLYTLIVVDAVGCTDTFNFSLQSPQLLELDLIVLDSILACFGALTLINPVISGGVSPYSMSWSDGDTNQQRIVGAGYYEIELVDANGCFTNESVIILEPDSLDISLSHTNISCNEGATATVTANGGVPPITYLWNTGETTSSIDSLWDLKYWVVVTDSCGASVTDTIYLNYYELNTLVYYDDSTHTGNVEIQSTTSSGPFEYIWLNIFNDSIGDGQISPVLCEGTYFVVVTDLSNNCSVTDTILVDFYIPLGVFDITTTTIFSDSDLWGFSPYTYLWSNGEDSIHANICAGDHWVEVTDINNCIVREDFTIENILISLDPESAVIECNLENMDIDLEASVTGGIEPYSFEWWNGSIENPINLGMSPGNFSITVTDANGCKEDTAFTIATMTSECIPNVFTPNNDSKNDTWSLEDTFLFEDSEVRIYGRFGRLLFQSVGYHDKWDGTNEKGNNVPEGVYFYSIEIGHGFEKINGSVIILR
jgi:gliding motility-associated-like protein